MTRVDATHLPRGLTLGPRAPGQRGAGLRAHHVLVAVVTHAAVLVTTVWIRGHLRRVTPRAWEEGEIRGWGNTALLSQHFEGQSNPSAVYTSLLICILSHMALNLLKGIMHKYVHMHICITPLCWPWNNLHIASVTLAYFLLLDREQGCAHTNRPLRLRGI